MALNTKTVVLVLGLLGLLFVGAVLYTQGL